jgi:pyruvate/2-oxoglutarate/acetoin dehydrogenase E1 component
MTSTPDAAARDAAVHDEAVHDEAATEDSQTRVITYAAALNEALREEMRRDPAVFCIGEDIAVWAGGGIYGVTRGLVEEFGEARIRDTPVSEEAIVGLSVGAALVGLRPVAEIMYSDFLTLAMDPIVNQAAKLRYMFGGQASVPMVIRTNSGAPGNKAAQHSQSLEAWFMHIPGLRVVTPSTPYDAKGMLKSAIRDDNPVLFLEHKRLYFTKGPVPSEEYTVPLGLAAIRRAGRHVTIVANHLLVGQSLEAADLLAEEEIELEVIDVRSLNPLDMETISASVRRTGRLIVAHEANQTAGWGAEVVAQVVERDFDYLDAPIRRVAAKNAPIPYAEGLERAVLPQTSEIVATARAVARS